MEEVVEVKTEEDDGDNHRSKKIRRKVKGMSHTEYVRQRRAAETPEKRAERLQKGAESKRRKRAEMKAEEMSKHRQKDNENHRRYREKLKNQDPERLQELRKREHFNRFVKIASMTEEELREHKMKKYLARQAWQSQNRRKDLPEEERERKRKRYADYLKNLTGEKKERIRESRYKAVRKYWDKIKENGEKPWRGNNTTNNKYWEKVKEEDPERWKKRQDKQKAHQRIKYANETPEQRLKRRYKDKVNGVKRKLRGQLEAEGVDKVEIERRLEELRVKMWREFLGPDEEIPGGNSRKRNAIAHNNSTYIISRSFEPHRPANPVKPPAIKAKVTETVVIGELGGLEDALQLGTDLELSTDAIPESPFSPCSPAPLSSPVSPAEEFSASNEPPTVPSEVTTNQFPSKFPEESQLGPHLRSAHPDKCLWKCPKCGEAVTSSLELSKHYQSNHKAVQQTDQPEVDASKYSFICMRCTPSMDTIQSNRLSRFRTRPELFAHVKKIHSEHFWPCEHCHLLKYSKHALHLHSTLCRQSPKSSKN